MARGYPDFFGMSIFPTYGELDLDTGDYPIVAPAAGTVHNLAFKGVLAGGWDYAFPVSADLTNYGMIITVDGNAIVNINLAELISRHDTRSCWPCHALAWDADTLILAIGWSREYNFGYQFRVDISTTLWNIAWYSRLNYYNIL